MMEQPPPAKRTKLDERSISAEDETIDRLSSTSLGSSMPSDQTTYLADQERSGTQCQAQGTGLTLSIVDSQPARPAPVSVAGEPVTYVPPFTVICPISTQPPILVAQPKTNQVVTITQNLERTVKLQASISNPLNPVCSENGSMSQMAVYGTARSDQGSRLLGAVAPQDFIPSTSPSSTTVTFQMSSSQTVSSLVVTRAESVFTSPSSRGPVTSLPEVSPKRKAYSDSDSHMQVDSIYTSLASRGIISCDLLPPPTPSEKDLVKASVAGLHYTTTLQSQSLSNVQESILQGAPIPQTMRPFLPQPHYTMATTPTHPTTVALQSSTHQPISSLQLARGSHGNDPHLVSSLLPVSEASEDSRIGLVKVLEPQIQFNPSNITPRGTASCDKLPTSIPSPSAKNPVQTRALELDSHSTSTTEGSSLQSAAAAHISSDLPLSDSDQSVAVSLSLPQASATNEDCLTSINPSEAGEAFREHRGDLLIAIIDPLILANSLYSKLIISRETLDEIMLVSLTNSKKNFILLDAVEARIRTNPSDFLTMIAVLGRDPHFCVYAERLKNSYCQMQIKNSLRVHPSIKVSATQTLDMYLTTYYNCSQESLDTKFPNLPNKTFITLAVIEKEPVKRADADEFTKGTLHGHADEILKKKKPIELEAVLEPPEGCQNMRCIFVEGAPGVGKSTFALELCRRRKEIVRMKNYSLVVLLRLREKRVQSIQKISDLFYHEDSDLVQAVTEEVVACQGKKVLFVLDGFDELPDNLRKDSFIVELIRGKHFPACTVLVTSRPSATADLCLRNEIDKHMEILGFTHECIQQYAKSMLSNQPGVLDDFLKYISNNPAIHGMMYIPLNSAIVVEIYKANRTTKKPIPHTLTQLYSELCFVLLRKYLSEICLPLADNIPENFLDIKGDLKDQLMKLGKLAFEGAVSKDITFEKLPEGCSHLGFMNVSTSLYLGRKSVVSYSFLHLTLQEFLAAYYVSLLDGIHQQLLIIQKFDLLKDGQRFNNSTHLNVMLRFIAGLTEFKTVGWDLASKAMVVYVKRNLTVPNKVNEIGFTPLLVQCLLEVQSKQKIREACDTISKHNSSEYQPFVSESNIFFSISPRTPFDCYAVGRCVAASGYQWIIKISNIGVNEAVESLGCGLRSVGEVYGCICELNISGNDLSHQAMVSLSVFPLKILNQINQLDLSWNLLDKKALECLAGSLSKMPNLTDLNLSRNPGGDVGMVKVFQSLLTTKIHTLNVLETTLGISDVQALSQLIRPGSTLKKLKIGHKDVPSEAIVETILSPSSLEEVELWLLNYTDVDGSKFQLLKCNRNLKKLKFINSSDGLKLVIPHVTKALHNNLSLKMLGIGLDAIRMRRLENFQPGFYEGHLQNFRDVYYNERECLEVGIDDDSVKAIAEMIKVNTTLEKLELLKFGLTTDHFLILKDALQMNKTLKNIYIHRKASQIDPRITSS